MSFWDVFSDMFSSVGSSGPDINPGSGLPMMDSMYDVAGNVYGFDDNPDMGSSTDICSGIGIGGLDDW